MPRFRTGHRVPLNVYDGDRPIFQAHSEQDAVEWVALLNVGHRAGTITTDEVAQVLFSSEAMPVNNVVLARDAADAMAVEVMHLLLTSRETPVERPTEPPPATGQPADRLVDLMAELERSVNEAKASRARKLAADVEDGS